MFFQKGTHCPKWLEQALRDKRWNLKLISYSLYYNQIPILKRHQTETVQSFETKNKSDNLLFLK